MISLLNNNLECQLYSSLTGPFLEMHKNTTGMGALVRSVYKRYSAIVVDNKDKFL